MAAPSFLQLVLPPPPVGMGPAPVGVTLLVPADQDAEADAGPAVAFLAKLVEADDLGLRGVLCVSWRCDYPGHA